MADTGLGATVVFTTTSTWAPQYISIVQDGFDRADLESTHLGTTVNKTFLPEELPDSGGFTATFFHDGDTQPPYNGAPETITITDPLQGAWSTGPKIAGSGYVNSYTPGNKEIGGLMIASMHVKWAGVVTFTDHT